MTFNDYQIQASATAIYPKEIGLYYAALGLAGESGEICNATKKIARDDNGVLSEEKRQALIKETGDVLWYLAALCTELNVSMDDVAEINLGKLASRAQRGTISGSGDNR